MARKTGDDQTRDLFEIPEPDPLPAELDCRVQVSALVGRMLTQTDADRFAVAADCSRMTGREVSKNMLDAYSSEARDAFNIPLYLVPAAEAACDSHDLSNWLARVRGGRLLLGRDALAGELARLERQRSLASKQINKLRRVMEVTG